MTLKRRDAAAPPPSVMVQTDASDHVSYRHGVGYSLFLSELYISVQAGDVLKPAVAAVQYCSSMHNGILIYRILKMADKPILTLDIYI
jgi:hypothetical protein